MDETTTRDNPTTTEIEYTMVKLDHVIQYFVNGYKPQEGEVKSHDFWLDTAKREVILRLFIEKQMSTTAVGGEDHE